MWCSTYGLFYISMILKTLKALGKKQYALERTCIIYMSDLLTSPHASFVCVCACVWVGGGKESRNNEKKQSKSLWKPFESAI